MRLIALLGLSVSPTVIFAEVCDKERPNWNGIPVTAAQEVAFLFIQPTQIILLAITVFVIYRRARISCGLLALVWTAFIPSLLTRDQMTQHGKAFKKVVLGAQTCPLACLLRYVS